MRALWVTNVWPDEVRPGQGSFIYSQAQSLIATGVEIDVMYMPVQRTRGAYLRGVGELRRRIAGASYDVVHAHFGYSGVVAATQRRVPLVISYLGADLLGQTAQKPGRITRKSAVLARVSAQAARLTDATITKSAEMETRLPASCRPRNHVIPNGVDLGFFSPIPREEALARLGWSDAEWNVLFVGNPALPRKNLAFAREVCAELERRGHRLTLRIAFGQPPADMPVMMSAATCLLFPSLSEGSPNTVKEAMAMELPIVSTRVGDTVERLTGVPGCHLIELDVGEAADAVELAAAAGRTPAARRAVEPLAIAGVAEQVKAVYAAAVTRRRGATAPAG